MSDTSTKLPSISSPFPPTLYQGMQWGKTLLVGYQWPNAQAQPKMNSVDFQVYPPLAVIFSQISQMMSLVVIINCYMSSKS